MKPECTCAAFMLVMGLFAAIPTVTAVSAQQRYPWNGKVDVVVTLNGTSNDVAQVKCVFAATNSVTQVALATEHITESGTMSGSGATWTRKFVWDATADVGEVKIPNVAFCVEVSPGGVQLWENGPYWAECNVGASKPEEHGYYFWWGDTVGYKYNASNDDWVSTKDGTAFSFSSSTCPTCGMDNSSLQSAGYIDATGNLVAVHDAATTHLGTPWRIPTDAECSALISNCTMTVVTTNGVCGQLVAGKGAFATKRIFVPAAGYGIGSSIVFVDSRYYYWSSTPDFDNSEAAWGISGLRSIRRSRCSRYIGCSVRPVRVLANNVPSVVTTHLVLDTTSGTRTAAASEAIRYSSAWETVALGATAVVSVNGEVVTNATGGGVYEWVPTRDGTYVLTHKVLAAGGQVGETLAATFVVDGLNPEAPIITPASGTTFATSLTVNMSCPSEGATVHYTTNGTMPTIESPVYKRFKINGKTMVKAIAFYENGAESEMMTAEYALGTCADPMVSLADGSVFQHSNQQVSIAWNDGDGVLRYTLDGSEPTMASPVYAGPFTVSESAVVKAKVFSDRYFDSAVVTVDVKREWLTVATPIITAAAEFAGSETKVVLSCATPGAQIRYTVNGKEPNSHSTRYTGPFWVDKGCTVKAMATCEDYLSSAVASFTIDKKWNIGDTMGAPDHAFTTEGDAAFFRVDDATAPKGESMRSGAIGNSSQYGSYNRSVLSTTVRGPGTLVFKWRSSCEQDDDYEWDHAEFVVDGVVVEKLNGVTDWRTVTQSIVGAGEHVVTWTYLKDDAEGEGDDCLWVVDFSWTSDEPYTHESAVAVPYAWICQRLPHTADEYSVYESTVKGLSANGHNTIEEAYIAGLDPADPTSELRALVTYEDGKVYVAWTPNLNTNGTTRIYKLYGRVNLVDGDWETPIQTWHRFFKVSVAMPTGAEGEETSVAGEGFVPEEGPGGVQLWENGPYWAECNVGASKPEEYGYYFWWGDTVGYKRNSNNDGWMSARDELRSEFSFCPENCPTYSKSKSTLQSEGYIDAVGNLVAQYDAATKYLGERWRLPTIAEWDDLVSNCDITWTTRNNVYGRIVTGKGAFASRCLFLPAAGFGSRSALCNAGSCGDYWSSSSWFDAGYSRYARCKYFDSSKFGWYGDYVYFGLSVRPVREFVK